MCRCMIVNVRNVVAALTTRLATRKYFGPVKIHHDRRLKYFGHVKIHHGDRAMSILSNVLKTDKLAPSCLLLCNSRRVTHLSESLYIQEDLILLVVHILPTIRQSYFNEPFGDLYYRYINCFFNFGFAGRGDFINRTKVSSKFREKDRPRLPTLLCW